MEKLKICRLCLEENTQHIEITDSILSQLIFLVPTIEWSSHKSFNICQECWTNLKAANAFKLLIMKVEMELLAELELTKTLKIDLSSLVDFKNSGGDELGNVCRVCLKITYDYNIQLYDCVSNSMPFDFVKEMCNSIHIMDLSLTDEPIMCNECWELLQRASSFKKMVIKKDGRFLEYQKAKNIHTVTNKVLKYFKLTQNHDNSSDDDSESDGCSDNSKIVEIKPEIEHITIKNEVHQCDGHNDEKAVVHQCNGHNDEKAAVHQCDDGHNDEKAVVHQCDDHNNEKAVEDDIMQPGLSYYSCKQCPYVTMFKTRWDKHYNAHNTDDPNLKQCKCCSFKSDDLTSHNFLHKQGKKWAGRPKRKSMYSFENLVKFRENSDEGEATIKKAKTELRKALPINRLNCKETAGVEVAKKDEAQEEEEEVESDMQPDLKESIMLETVIDDSGKVCRVWNCVFCTYKHYRLKHILKHLVRHGSIHAISGQITCPRCRGIFLNQNQFQKHVINYYKVVPDDIKCDKCGRIILQPLMSSKHREKCMGKPPRSGERRIKNVDPNVIKKRKLSFSTCPICLVTISRSCFLRTHLKRHLKHDKCPICQTNIVNFHAWKQHFIKEHENMENSRFYECLQCSFQTDDREKFCNHKIRHVK